MSGRTAGLFGRLPGTVPVGLRDLSYYVAGPLPAGPSYVSIPQIRENWGMLGNDQKGNCGPVGFVHGSMAAEAVTGEHVLEPTAAEVLAFGSKYGYNNGTVLSQFLAQVRSLPQGMLGHTLDSYAPMDVRDVPQLRSGIYLFDFVYSGIVVTAAMQQAFENGQPWTVDTFLNGPVIGGHCVPLIAYGPNGLICVTWGAIQCITWDAWPYIASEAWAPITGDLVNAHGDGRDVNLAALHADLELV